MVAVWTWELKGYRLVPGSTTTPVRSRARIATQPVGLTELNLDVVFGRACGRISG
jgi:hypothetical protein